jgi:hypothetical protein
MREREERTFCVVGSVRGKVKGKREDKVLYLVAADRCGQSG